MWENREYYAGLSVLPYSDHTYKQAPFEDCTKEVFESMSEHLHGINLENVIELDDATDAKGELACAGGACEIV
jgi:ribonucleoside-diphosphate reductase alpha chain